MECKVICAGFGGQGVLSLGKFLVYGAMEEGLEVTWLPSYGPEMRGGTANVSVVMSDKEVASPLITVPNVLVAMNGPSLDKFVDKVAPNGTILINSDLIDTKVERKDVNVVYVPANTIANEVSTARSANIVMLGAFIKNINAVTKEAAVHALQHQFEGKKGFESIMAAFEAGFRA